MSYKYDILCSGLEIGENNDSQADEEEWPPFRRVGTFDPYSDDPRLAIKRVSILHIDYVSHCHWLKYRLASAIRTTKCGKRSFVALPVGTLDFAQGRVWISSFQ